jgi:nucleoside-diphosphate-sugar epimerase
MEKVIITGANGLIGSHIAEYFLSKGIHPVCMVREKSNADFLKSIGSDIVHGDITDLKKLMCVFSSGADFIIHTAAKVGDWGNYDEFYNVNVLGTLNVLKAANLHNIKNVIITGSISCYGEESSSIVKDENQSYNSHYNYFLGRLFPSCFNYYRDTKAEANIKAIEYAQANSICLTILDPAWVYGEREFHSGFYDFLKTVKSGLFLVPGSKKNKFHTIYARDLAKIYYLAYQKRLQGINKILAVAPTVEYQFKLLDLFCEKAGYNSPSRIPKSLIYLPAFLTELFYTFFRIKNPPPISRARVNIFYDNIEYSSEKLTNQLGFIPDYSLEESVENTVRWYKENNYL